MRSDDFGTRDGEYAVLRDNLTVPREHVSSELVDMVYLDPPFNSNASYNVLFKERTGEESPARLPPFEAAQRHREEGEQERVGVKKA